MPKRLQGSCVSCQRKRARHDQGMRRRGRPYEQHKPSLRRVDQEAYLARRRQQYVVLARRRRKEWSRIRKQVAKLPQSKPAPRSRRARKAEAKRARQMSVDEKIGRAYARSLLPIKPFSGWLRNYVNRGGKLAGDGGLADITGVPDRTLRACKNTTDHIHNNRSGRYRRQHVSLDVVDRVLAAEGNTLLWDLYPELYA